ncbi:hypothetical protein GEZ72_04730, partial [Streptococcus mitis]|nr:hypothetical protein [Streptococcus mitis]
MYFNRKNAEQKNWRMIKKGKHFLFGCSLVFAVGASLATQTVHADTAAEATVESGSKAEEAKSGYGGETGTYEAPATVAEIKPEVATTPAVATVAEKLGGETAKEVKALDKTQLESYISEIEAKLANGTYDNKTEESIVVLKADLEAAKATLANATTQDELTKAYNKLVTTVNTKLQAKPVEKKETPAVDTTNGKETVGKKAENTEKKSESNSIENTGTNDPRNGKALDKNSAFRATVNGSLAEGEFANNNNKVKQFTSVHYSIDGDRTVWTIGVVPSTKSDQVTGLVAASDDVIESITVSDRGPKGGALIEEYYVNKNSFDKVPLNHQKALVSRYKAVGGATPDTLAYRVVTRGTHHNLFARFASATVKRTLENNGLNGHTAVLGGQRYSDFPTVGVNISSRLAPQPEVNNTYTQTNDTITVPTVASTDETLTGTGTPGARINIKSEGKTVNDTTIVGSNGQWTFPITIGLNSNVTGGAQLVPGSQISVSQTVNGQESAATPVNVSLGHSEIVPSDKSQQKNNLVQGEKNVTLKVPHDAGAAYFQFTDADGKAQEVGLKRDAVPGKWQVNSSSSALASVTSSEQGSHYSTINLTLNKDMKAGTTAKVISNMQEGSYSSLQGWQSRNVEEAPKEAPKPSTPAPVTPQPEAPKPSTPAVDAATSGPEIVNDLAGKASTPANVTIKAPAGSTVKLYNKDGVVIGEAVANDQGVATVTPTNSLPEGEITATSTPAGGKESAKSTPITVTKTPLTEGEVRQQYVTDLTLIVSKNLVTVYPGDKIDIDVWADGTPSLEKFDAYQNPTGVAGVFPQGHFFQTSGSEKWRDKKNKYIGTVAETQKAGTVDVGFVASNKKGRQFTDVIRVVVLESAKKYEPVAGTKVDVADPNKVSEDEKNKIIDSVKTANPSLPANATYSVDEKGNLTITYPDGSKDKVAAAYLVNPTTPATPVVAPTVEIPYSNKATKEVYVYGGEENSFDIKFKDDSGKIASATVRQGGNREFDPVAGEANTINTQYGFKANVINAETPATEKAPAVITYSGTPAATDGLKQETLDAATKGENPEGMALGWRYATATDKDGAFIENKAVGSSNATDPGSFRVMLKAQTQKYDIATPTEKVTVADPANVTEAELAKIKEKVQLEYSQNNDDANLADKKGTAVADKDAKIKSIEKDADGNLVVTYADGSQDKKPLSEFVTKATPVVAPTVEIPYSNKATKEVYVYGGEENSFDIKFKDDSGKIASATVRQGGNREFDPVAGEANTINTQYGFKANVINAETPATEKAPAVITYSGTPAATDGLAKDKLEAATKGENPEGMALGWRYATATDKDGAFIENKAVGSSTATDPGAFRVMLKGQTQKYDIATPTEKVTVADPANVTDADLAKIKEKLQLEYSQNNDDANLADKKGKAVADKDAKIQSVTKDDKGNLVVTYTDGSQDKKPLSEFVTKKPTDADKNTPTAKPQTVNKGTTPKAEDSIGNVKDLPKGTKVAFKDPVDTATPGEKDATVVVTYPDGSKEEVPVKVTVKDPSSAPTDADKNTPT